MADVESALMTFLDDLGYTVTSTPADLEQHLPVIRIRRVGGSGDEVNDFPRVSIQAMTAASSTAPRAHFDLAESIADRIFGLAVYGPQVVDGVCLESPAKDSGPVELTYPNPSVRVAETIWRLTIRR